MRLWNRVKAAVRKGCIRERLWPHNKVKRGGAEATYKLLGISALRLCAEITHKLLGKAAPRLRNRIEAAIWKGGRTVRTRA